MSSTINFGDKFKSEILAMITSGTSNDVKIVLEDGEILANKDVLCARSEYFSTMFSNNNIDNQVKFMEGEANKVDMGHCSKVIMEKIINYLFSGDMKFHDLSLPDLVRITHMTSMMLLNDIHEVIKEYVLEIIPDSAVNCACLPDMVHSLMLAVNFGLDELREALVHELFFNLKDVHQIPEVVRNSEAFKELPANLVKEILCYNQLREFEDEEEGTSPTDQITEADISAPATVQDEDPEPKPKKRRKSRSRSKRAGLVFPTSKINRRIKEDKYANRLGKGADVYMAAVMEHLVAEVFELSGRVSNDHKRDRVIPRDIQLAIALDEEFSVFNHNLSSISIPEDVLRVQLATNDDDNEDEDDQDHSNPDDTDDDTNEEEEYNSNEDAIEDDQDYRHPADTDDEDFHEDEDYNSDKDDKIESRWVGDKDRFHAFLYWLSGNECSDEDKEEITGSFNLLCGCFTAEDLLTDVRRSGLYYIKEIDDTVLEIISRARKEIKTQDEDEICYLKML